MTFIWSSGFGLQPELVPKLLKNFHCRKIVARPCSTTPRTTSYSRMKQQPLSAVGTRETRLDNNFYLWDTTDWFATLSTRPLSPHSSLAPTTSELGSGQNANDDFENIFAKNKKVDFLKKSSSFHRKSICLEQHTGLKDFKLSLKNRFC